MKKFVFVVTHTEWGYVHTYYSLAKAREYINRIYLEHLEAVPKDIARHYVSKYKIKKVIVS